jgi:hypothetical protein
MGWSIVSVHFMEFRFAWQFYLLKYEKAVNVTDIKDTNIKNQVARVRKKRFASMSRFCVTRDARHSIHCLPKIYLSVEEDQP